MRESTCAGAVHARTEDDCGFVCARSHLCVRVCVCACVRVRVHIYVHVCAWVWVCVWTCVNEYMHVVGERLCEDSLSGAMSVGSVPWCSSRCMRGHACMRFMGACDSDPLWPRGRRWRRLCGGFGSWTAGDSAARLASCGGTRGLSRGHTQAGMGKRRWPCFYINGCAQARVWPSSA